MPGLNDLHPHHDALHRELRGWFTTSAPDIGYFVSERWYGYLTDPGSAYGARLILDVAEGEQVSEAVIDATRAWPKERISIWVDDRDRVRRLDGALRKLGYRPAKATTHLALVDRLEASKGPEDLVIEGVDPSDLERWATVKLQSFENVEQIPSPERLSAEIAVRRGELALADYQLGIIEQEPVAVLAYYRGPDQLVFVLGTRVPYRNRGIAQAMLSSWVRAGLAAGCRSLMINADDPGMPADLYRKIGFVDEVYWYQRYEFEVTTESAGLSAPSRMTAPGAVARNSGRNRTLQRTEPRKLLCDHLSTRSTTVTPKSSAEARRFLVAFPSLGQRTRTGR